MRSFKKFLEAEVKPFHKESKSLDELAQLAAKHCKIALDNYLEGPNIWRGWIERVAAGVFDSSEGIRKSENTTNIYTQLFDTNPANAGWPKRSKSFICSTNISTAEGYAAGSPEHLTLVLPYDDIKIAAVGEDDIWDRRIYAINQSIRLPRTNSLISNMYKGLFPGSIKAPEDLNFIDFSKDLEAVPDDKWLEFVQAQIDSDATNTSANQFRTNLIKTFSFDDRDAGRAQLFPSVMNLPGGSEVWFSGKCIVIPDPQIEEFIDMVGEYL